MAKVKKPSMIDIVLIAVAVICLVLVIVGLLIDYVTETVEVMGVSTSGSASLANINATQSDYKNFYGYTYFKGLGFTNAFAYITLVLAILAVICLVLYKLLDKDILKKVSIVVSALLIISAVIAIIAPFCMSTNSNNISNAVSYSPAVGAWLLCIGGILGGAACILGGLNILNKKNA